MISKIDVSIEQNAEAILHIQKEAYSMEADLIDYYGSPALIDDVEDIMWSEAQYYGYEIEGQLVAFIAYKIEEGIFEITRLAVCEEHHQKGIGTALIRHVENFVEDVDKIIISAAFGNMPAEELYVKLGYNLADVIDVVIDEDEDEEFRQGIYEKNYKQRRKRDENSCCKK